MPSRNFLLKPTDSLGTAMQRGRANGEGFAAVVDEERKLLGTFHDADGRAAMLRGVSLDEPVGEVMATRRTASHGYPALRAGQRRGRRRGDHASGRRSTLS